MVSRWMVGCRLAPDLRVSAVTKPSNRQFAIILALGVAVQIGLGLLAGVQWFLVCIGIAGYAVLIAVAWLMVDAAGDDIWED